MVSKSSSTKVKFVEFLSVSAHIIYHSKDVMKSVLQSKNLSTQYKGDVKEPFTEADVKIQTFIFSGLKYHFPTLNVQGEEDEVYEGKFDVDPATFKKDVIDVKLFEGKIPEEFDTNDAVVWVDPIDATASFISGDLEHCTTLIGLAINGEAVVGVIGHYYSRDEVTNELIEAPKVYFSHAEHNKIFVMDLDKGLGEPKSVEVPKTRSYEGKSTKLRVPRGSKTENAKNLLALLEKNFDVEVNNYDGAGIRMLMIALDLIDVYVEDKNLTKRWDICAGDALIRSAGFFFTDFEGGRYKYPSAKVGHYNDKGLVVTRNQKVHEEVLEALKSYSME